MTERPDLDELERIDSLNDDRDESSLTALDVRRLIDYARHLEAEVERLRGFVLDELSAESQRLGLPE